MGVRIGVHYIALCPVVQLALSCFQILEGASVFSILWSNCGFRLRNEFRGRGGKVGNRSCHVVGQCYCALTVLITSFRWNWVPGSCICIPLPGGGGQPQVKPILTELWLTLLNLWLALFNLVIYWQSLLTLLNIEPALAYLPILLVWHWGWYAQ